MLKCQSSSNKINDRGKHSKTSHSNKSLKEVKKSFDKEIPNQKQKNKFNSSNIINIKQETKHLQEIESSTFFQDCLDNKHDEIKQSDIVISVNEKEPNENKKNPIHRTDAEKKWRVILNVMKALSNMRNFNTNDVKSISDLDQRFNLWLKEQPKALKLSSDNPKDTMDLVLRQFKLFDYVASGLDSNIEKIKKILKSDPKLNIFDDKEAYFVNQKNYEGHTSLYVACLHGHLKIVQVLLENKADHLILCGGEDDKESILDTSIRWGHLKLVEYLLDNLKWPQDYLKSALKKAIDGKNEKMIQMVKKSIAQTRKTNLGQCRCVLF